MSGYPSIAPKPPLAPNKDAGGEDIGPSRSSRLAGTGPACKACQTAKSRCDRARPRCKRCRERGFNVCEYEATGPERKRALEDENRLLRAEVSRLRRLVGHEDEISSPSSYRSFDVQSQGEQSIGRKRKAGDGNHDLDSLWTQDRQGMYDDESIVREPTQGFSTEQALKVCEQAESGKPSPSAQQDTSRAAMQAFSEPMWSSPVENQPAPPPDGPPGQTPQKEWHSLLATKEGNVAANEQYSISKGDQDTAQTSQLFNSSEDDILGSDSDPYAYGWARSIPGYVERFGNLPMSSSLRTNNYDHSVQQAQLRNLKIHEHFIRPLQIPDSSQLSMLFTKYFEAATTAMLNGFPINNILDPTRICVELIFRKRHWQDPFAVSTFSCEWLKSMHEQDIFATLGSVMLNTHLVRWMLFPTAEQYRKLPPMIRPHRSQRLLPHPPSSDFCPFPAVREILMRQQRDWITPKTTLNWPFGLDEAVTWDPQINRRVLTGQFEHFASDPTNWSLDQSTFDTFPELRESGMQITRPGAGQLLTRDVQEDAMQEDGAGEMGAESDWRT